jgi:hypothetical protein
MIHPDWVSFQNALAIKLPNSSHIVLLLQLATQLSCNLRTTIGRNPPLISALQNNNPDSRENESIKKT